MFEMMDRDKDGKLSRDEMAAMASFSGGFSFILTR